MRRTATPTRGARAGAAAALVAAVTLAASVAGFVAAATECSSEGASEVTDAERRTVACLDGGYDGTWGDVQGALAALFLPGLLLSGVLVVFLVARRRTWWPVLLQPAVAAAWIAAHGAIGGITVPKPTATLDGVALTAGRCATRGSRAPGGVPRCADGVALRLRLGTQSDVGLRLTVLRRVPRTQAEIDAAIDRPRDPTFLASVAGRSETRRSPQVADRLYRLGAGAHVLPLRPTRDVDLDPLREPSGHRSAPLPRGRYELEVTAWAAGDPNAPDLTRTLVLDAR